MTDSQWRRVIDINLTGSFNLVRSVGRQMAEQGSGSMLFIASDRGTYGLKNGSPYASSKAGVVGLVKSAALELGQYGVTVNALNPGTTDTPTARSGLSEAEWISREEFDPLGRLSRPEDIAEIALFLATSGGRFMTGQLITTRMRTG